MRHSDSVTKLAAALVKAQQEVHNASKDSSNPHFGNTYASLNSVIDAVKPIFNTHGIAIVQLPSGAGLETVLLHESGEWMAETAEAPLQKQDPQGVGSALTYLRRYSLAAVAQIGQDDDDANEASTASWSGAPSRPKEAHEYAGSAPTKSQPGHECPNCASKLWDNRASKASGKFKPTYPDLKCSNKECDWVRWLDSWSDDLVKEADAAHQAAALDQGELERIIEACAQLDVAAMLVHTKRLMELARY